MVTALKQAPSHSDQYMLLPDIHLALLTTVNHLRTQSQRDDDLSQSRVPSLLRHGPCRGSGVGWEFRQLVVHSDL